MAKHRRPAGLTFWVVVTGLIAAAVPPLHPLTYESPHQAPPTTARPAPADPTAP